MRTTLAAWFACLVVLCGGDLVWLGLVARDFYATALATLLRAQPNWAAALAFYPLYAAGLTFFCVTPALATGGSRQALARGALFGLVAYATYDLSNLATLQSWPLSVACADIAWGILISALAALAGHALARLARGRTLELAGGA